MKLQKILITGVLTLISLSSLAEEAPKLISLDCRQGEQFWDTNKGVEFDLTSLTAQQYKDNGYTKVGDAQPAECELSGRGIVCTGGKFTLKIEDLSRTTRQADDGNLSSLLGSLVGAPNPRVDVTKGSLTVDGIIFTRTHDVVCSVKVR